MYNNLCHIMLNEFHLRKNTQFNLSLKFINENNITLLNKCFKKKL